LAYPAIDRDHKETIRDLGNPAASSAKGGKMTLHIRRAAVAALLLGVSSAAMQAEMMAPTAPPEAPKFDAQGEPVYVNRADIFEFKALPAYSEPAWVKAFVDAGKLPAVADRLPKEPLVYKTANMPDGTSLVAVLKAGTFGPGNPTVGAVLISAWSNV
jgi:hypothetical protein